MVLRPSRRGVLLGAFSLAATSLSGCLTDRSDWDFDRTLHVEEATLYQGPNCPCCADYVAYLDPYLSATLETHILDDITALKRELGIEQALWSCHTVRIDDYSIEGHVPVEFIDTLIYDDRSISSIALPGMPAGSPGMGGRKGGEWIIYGIFQDGHQEVFARV